MMTPVRGGSSTSAGTSTSTTTPPVMALPLPPIDVCLYGASRKCPPTRDPRKKQKGGGTKDPMSLSNFLNGHDGHDDSIFYDSISQGHWGQAEAEHDIDLSQLRRIASQGIVDEGSHRAVAWRVLLGYLPLTDIASSWKPHVQHHRSVYTSLVQEYFEGPLDPGRELRGHLSKKLRNPKLRTKLDQPQRLDYDSDQDRDNRCGGGAGAGNDTSDDDDDDNDNDNDNDNKLYQGDDAMSLYSEQTETTGVPMVNTKKIREKLPPKFREMCKKSGIAALEENKASSETTTTATTFLLGINQLLLPKKLQEDNPDDIQRFQLFLENARLLEEIRKDVVRTHPDLYFFLEPNKNLGQRRYAAIERILFIWAKLNKGVRICRMVFFCCCCCFALPLPIESEMPTPFFTFFSLSLSLSIVLDGQCCHPQNRFDTYRE